MHGAADTRLDDATEAARHGKHVLLELPPAAGADAVAALDEQCAGKGVGLMIGGTLRFLPSQQVLKQRLDSGQLGELGLLRAHRWHAGAGSGAGWHDLAVPYLDLANWLFGDRPERVYARAAGADYVQIHLGFRAGGMALIDVSAGLPPGDGYRSVSVIGSAGAGYADDHHNRALLFVGGGDPAARDPGRGQPRPGRRVGRLHRGHRGGTRAGRHGGRCPRRVVGGGGRRGVGGGWHGTRTPGGSL